MTPHREEAERLFDAVNNALTHEGDTAGFCYLDQDEVVPIIESALAAAEQRGAARALRDAADEFQMREWDVRKWLRARADAISTGSTKSENAKG
jgi:hypothetical protein